MKNARDKALGILNKFDTNFYIKNDKREAMIEEIAGLIDEGIALRELVFNTLKKKYDTESLLSFIKRRYFKR